MGDSRLSEEERAIVEVADDFQKRWNQDRERITVYLSVTLGIQQEVVKKLFDDHLMRHEEYRCDYDCDGCNVSCPDCGANNCEIIH